MVTIAVPSLRQLNRSLRTARQDLKRRVAARLVSDRDYLERLYRREFGRSPALDHPRGFNEKILCKILHDRRRYQTLFADKLRVRGHVRRAAPSLALPTLYWWSASADALPFDSLPEAFALKANHGSGWVRLVRGKAQASRDELASLARRWLHSDFTIVGREWAYRDVHRAVYVEQLLDDGGSGDVADYKLFVFGGRARLIQVDENRSTSHTQTLYDERWNPIEGTVAAAQGRFRPPPASLATMIAAAEAISLGVDFVRVDLYEIGGHAYFGELASTPNKGMSPFRPASLDAWLGELLHPDDYGAPRPDVRYSESVDEAARLAR